MGSKVLELIYWRDVQWTGVVFTGTVLGLICMFQLSFITVVSTLSLAVMCFTLTVRLYYNLLHMLQRDDGVNPFQPYLDCDISFSGDSANYYMECVIVHTVSAFAQAWKVLLVSNFIHSLMVLMLAYLMTFVGTVVNLLTLLIIGVIALFSLPLFYRQHREKINRLVAGVATLLAKISAVFHRLSQGAIGPAPGGAKPKTK